MSAATLLGFTLVAFLTIVTPGPTVLLAFANGARGGRRAALGGMAGAAASDIVLFAAAGAGMGAALAASETAFTFVKWAGVGWLGFLGVTMLRARPQTTDAGATPSVLSAGEAARRSFLVAVTNPKAYLFVAALLPPFIDPAAAAAPQIAALAALFVGIDLAVMAGYAFAGARAARLARGRGLVWLERLGGAALLGLAGSLALARRAA